MYICYISAGSTDSILIRIRITLKVLENVFSAIEVPELFACLNFSCSMSLEIIIVPIICLGI